MKAENYGNYKVKMIMPASLRVISAENKLVEVSSISFIAGLSPPPKEWLSLDPEEQGAMMEEGVRISTSR
jgi:hypothetical protein